MLLLTAKVQKLASPNSRSLSILRECLDRSAGPGEFLQDIEAEPWNVANARDLVVLSPEGAGDGLAAYLDAAVMPFYHRYFGSRFSPHTAEGEYGKIWEYKGRHLILFGNFLCMLLSAAIPTASIIAMNSVSNTLYRLLMIGGFCILFAGAMTFIVGGRRVDVFAATTAFAAIQAVFIGGTDIVHMNQ